MNISWICYCGRHGFILIFLFHWHFSPLRVAFSCCNCYFVAWPGCCDGRRPASRRIFQELLLNFAIFKYLSHQMCVIVSLAPPGQRLLDTQLHIFLGWHALVVFRLCKRNIYSKFVDILSLFLIWIFGNLFCVLTEHTLNVVICSTENYVEWACDISKH